jgi:ferredoxin-NADP reductase
MQVRTLPRRLSWQLGAVASIVEETPRTKSIFLDLPDWPGHLPGQHIDVRLTVEDGYQAQRSYSIASPPEVQQVAITVENLPDGEVSPYLTDELRPGDQLELRGPIGGYFTWTVEVGGPLLLIAGGSGVVPLMAMIRHAGAMAGAIPIRLLYSSRTFADIIYRAELEDRARTTPGLEVIHTLTREQPPGWTGYTRRIDEQMLQEVGWAPAEQPRIFICGPTRLVENAATTVQTLGHDPARIKTERFGPSGGA